MSYRRKKKGNLMVYTGFFLTLALLVGTYFAMQRLPEELRGEALPVAKYLEAPDQYINHTYRLEAVVELLLAGDFSGRTLYAVNVRGERYVLPVMVEKATSSFPLQRGQNIILRVDVLPSGLLHATYIIKA